MNLRKLDLYMELPSEACEYSAAVEGNAMDGSNNPPLDKSNTIAAATRIADMISQKQKDPLECLTMRISRQLFGDRFQPCNTHTGFQLRSKGQKEGDEDRYEVRGKMEWWGYSSSPSQYELLFA